MKTERAIEALESERPKGEMNIQINITEDQIKGAIDIRRGSGRKSVGEVPGGNKRRL